MAMEINGNLLDYSVKKQNYNSYAAQSMAGTMQQAARKRRKQRAHRKQQGATNQKVHQIMLMNWQNLFQVWSLRSGIPSQQPKVVKL